MNTDVKPRRAIRAERWRVDEDQLEVDTFWKTRRLRIAEAPSLWPIGRETVFRKFYQSISSFRIKSRLFIYLFRRQQNVGQEPLRSILLPRLVGIYAGQCVLSNDRGNK